MVDTSDTWTGQYEPQTTWSIFVMRVKRRVRIDVQTKGRGIGTLLRRTKVSPASADLQIHRRTRRPIPPLRGYLIKSTINSR